MVSRARKPAIERFWDKVKKGAADECWEWLAYKDGDGYGTFRVETNKVKAHRFSYELHIGPIPAGLQVCHHCDNPPCVNPNHLFLGTGQDNTQDMMEKGRNRPSIGEQHGGAVLTDEQVLEIRSLWQTGQFTQRQLGERFGISRRQARAVIKGENWQHLPVGPARPRIYPSGEQAANAKLTADKVRAIRRLYRSGEMNQVELAAVYGVTQSLISAIVRRLAWAALADEEGVK